MTRRGATPNIDPVRAVFPRRKLAVRPPRRGWRAVASDLVPVLLLYVALDSMVKDWVPALMLDLPLALTGRAEPIPEQYLGPGSACRLIARAVETCELALRARRPDGLWQSRQFETAALFASPGTIEIVGLMEEPYWISTRQALDTIWNRLATALLLIGGGLVAMVHFLRGAWRRARAPRRLGKALSGQALEPVALRGFSRQGGIRIPLRPGGGFDLELCPDGPAVPRPEGDPGALMPLGDDAGGLPRFVLGVRPVGGGPVLPLDRALGWIDLTEAEGAALRQALTRVRTPS